MMFSVLIPTRDRLEPLKLAIESARSQDYQDWEAVVTDNASAQDVPRYVASLGDRRIRCLRSDIPVPVCENWNSALRHSRGRYFIMLGDDDALMPGSLAEAARLIERWREPDAIYAQARQFAYPGVVPDHPQAFLQTGYNEFLEGAREPFVLDRAVAIEMVRSAAAFFIRYGFNMQHFVIRRALADRLAPKGPFFQSPYPDYYAANAVLLAAETLVATPSPLAMIGISPRSFGFYYVNDREKEGVQFLQTGAEDAAMARLRKVLVPGSNMNDSWLCAMHTLVQNFPEVPGLRVRYDRYRRLQYGELLRRRRRGDLSSLLRSLRAWEFLVYGIALAAWAATLPLPGGGKLRHRLLASLFGRAPQFDLKRAAVPYRDILEAARGSSG